MKKTISFLFSVLFLFAFVGCARTDARIDKVMAYPYKTGDRMGLSVWMTADLPSEEGLYIALTSPDENLTWNTVASKDVFDSITYYGCADFSMPSDTALPKGEWKVELICRDGQVSEAFFNIDYTEDSITVLK